MSTLFIRLPARIFAANQQTLLALPCAYWLHGKRDVVEREGIAQLTDLSVLIRNAQQVVLLLAAVDVNVLRMAVPPLSAGKLRTAIPNLIEDKLLADIADCAVACSATGSTRSVAVVQRAWLMQLVQTLRGLGAQRVSAYPEQLCLVQKNSGVVAAISEQQHGVSLALRLSEHEDMGLIQDTPEQILHSLRTLVPEQNIELLVAPHALARYQTLLAQDAKIQVSADAAACWQLGDASLDLTQGLGAQHQAQWHWQPWRWAIILATVLLLVNICALNFDWWHKRREADNLRASLKQIYVSAFPKETVILDPLLQMRQKIAAGQNGTDEFSILMAEFGTAWSYANPATTITGIDYHDHSLSIQLKSEVAPDALQSALAARHVSLLATSNLSWQIRSQP